MKREARKINRGTKRTLLIIVSLVMLLSTTGVVWARYVSTNKREAQMLSSDFHISSNYLEIKKENARYTVVDWGNGGISFELHNYEKENVTQIAGTDIQYTITVSDGWEVEVKDEHGKSVEKNNGGYIMPGDGTAKHTHTVHLKTDGNAPGQVEVKVETNDPYVYELMATFNTVGQKLPDYIVKDMGDYVLVTLRSNDYSEHIEVTWDENFSPDNHNRLMATWTDEQRVYLMKLETNMTYELIFVKNQNVTVKDKSVTLTDDDKTLRLEA